MIGKTIAIYGGSFDPPHIGHELIVHEVLSVLNDIDQFIVVPTYLNPFKSDSFLDSTVRYSLVQQLFKDVAKVAVSDFEIKQERKVFTLDTVNFLKQQYDAKKIYLIIGSDNAQTFHLWHEYEQLKSIVELVVITRKNYAVDGISINVDVDVSSTQLRQELNLDLIPKKIQNEVKKIWNKE
ncbi:MAG: nicotinate (nicotinamide) nucleotide adenylyltransferase [Campylobacterota bacterium]|nr:nicotinate (nicotinamide) nucleotide adenylyltransferase [Campylobacterota bacterium]